MTYSKKLTLRARSHINPITEKMQELKEGEFFVFGVLAEHMTKMREWIYTWATLAGLQGVYRQRLLSPEQLQITRIALPKFTLNTVPLSSSSAFVRDKLLDIETEDDAILQIRKGVESGELTEENVGDTLSEWRDKCLG